MRLLAVCAGVALACRAPAVKPAVDDTQAAADTLRGTFVLEGSDPFPMAVVRTSSGRVVIDGATAGMLKLSQLDLWLRGIRTSANRFHVADYRVRGANGARAWDGKVRNGPTGFRLELDDGSLHDIRGAPVNFAQLIGSRVWVTESPDGTLREYGVI
ncbi:MAG TPA: hypothetical protein VII30_12435 [Gemmatimonadaceae bacterium]